MVTPPEPPPSDEDGHPRKEEPWVPENISHRKPAAVVAFVLAVALTVSAFFVLVTRKNSGKTYAT